MARCIGLWNKLGLLLFVASAGCGAPTVDRTPPAPPVVLVTPAIEREIVDFQVFTGTLAAPESVEVRSRVSGYLDKMLLDVGKEVKKGDKLFLIDQRPFKASLEKAEGDLDRIKAAAKVATAELARQKNLLGQRATSQADYDKAAGHEAEAQAAIRGALGSVETARTNLDFTDIRSPIEGRVSRNFISEGNLVTADQTLLTTIVSEDPIHVYFNVDEKSVLRLKEAIRKGTFKSAREAKVPVQFALANEEGFPHEAIIDFVDNKIDTSMGSIQVRAVARNVERRFTPGFFVQVRLNTSMPFTGLLVPDRSIGTDQGRKFVYVVDDKDEVQKRLVTTGALHDKLRVVDRFENRPKFDAKGVPMLDSAGKQIEERVEILSPKDRVIFEGVQRVRPGMKVAPKETKQ